MKYLNILAVLILCCLVSCGNRKQSESSDADKPVSAVPAGYKLVWSDEFDDTPNGFPGYEWWFDIGGNGWGNNERQVYVNRLLGADTVAKVQNGFLTITAHKLQTPYQGSDIISARMNTVQSWRYGYFEMRAKLPGGRGTWAAFWMLPQNFQRWPHDGEIDIMEYVGYRPDIAQAAIHSEAYNHVAGSEKTDSCSLHGVEENFYVYGLLWTEDEIKAYVDGEEYFSFSNDKEGKKSSWPFNEPFYLKLNLAIGGDWGGKYGIDPDIFPARYVIDYVRVYQQK